MPSTPEPAPAPTRNERKACWSHRDSYFSCLTQKGITVPPGTDMSDGRGPIGKAAKEEQERLEREKKLSAEEARKQDPCIQERQGYETNCARSWVRINTDFNRTPLTIGPSDHSIFANSPIFALLPAFFCIQVDYFNKRRVLEERQRMMYAQADAGQPKP